VFENSSADPAGRRARLSAAVERLAAGHDALVVPASTMAGPNSGQDAGPVTSLSGRLGDGSTPDDQGAIPMRGPLAELLPGGIQRGDAVAIETGDQAIDYLTLALLAGALGAGLWCGVVGVPELGAVALAELASADARGAGADRNDASGTGAVGISAVGTDALDRLLLVPEPGERWAEIVAVLADGVDLVLVRPSTAVTAEVGRRVDARLRRGRSAGTRHSAALLVLGSWTSARVVLRTERTEWRGLAGAGERAGVGQLAGGWATVVAEGRATGGRVRTAKLWLPAADGLAADTPSPRALKIVA
jgi:hypothetical protein